MVKSLKFPNLVILASSSINRIKLLEQIGINPVVIQPECEENLSKTLPPEEYAIETAYIKNVWVYNKLVQEKKDFDVIIACDTIISFNSEIIGKPLNLTNAKETLEKLNGKTHQVITGVALRHSTGRVEKFYVKSNVTFNDNQDSIIEDYVVTGEPMGHAGSYAIQKKGAILVKSIEGCYNNIVGLPLSVIYEKIRINI